MYISVIVSVLTRETDSFRYLGQNVSIYEKMYQIIHTWLCVHAPSLSSPLAHYEFRSLVRSSAKGHLKRTLGLDYFYTYLVRAASIRLSVSWLSVGWQVEQMSRWMYEHE